MDKLILEEDLDSIKRMLGCDEQSIPGCILAEYRVRLRMFHCNGHSGPMGTLGLIDLLRSLKYGPRKQSDPLRIIDWSRMPTNGTLHVEAKVHITKDKMEWQPGVYLGRVGVGGVAVRLDGHKWVHEFSPRDVRIPISKEEETEVKDGPPPTVITLEPPQPVHQRKSRPKIPSIPPEDGKNPLNRAKIGDDLWVQEEEDLLDASYQGRIGDEILVLVEGEEKPRSFPESKITYAKI